MNAEDSQNLDRIKRIYRGPCHDFFPDAEFLLDLLDRHDQRETELLGANSELVSARRVAQGRAEHFAMSLDFLTRQAVRQQAALGAAIEERDAARRDAAVAWREAARYMRQADQNHQKASNFIKGMAHGGSIASRLARADKMIAEKARVWFRRLMALDGDRNIENNKAYTEAHLALRRECAMQELAQEGQEIGVGYEKQETV